MSSQATLKDLLADKREEKRSSRRSQEDSSSFLRTLGRSLLLLMLIIAPWCIGSVHSLPQFLLLAGITVVLGIWWLDFAFFVKSGRGLVPYIFFPVFVGWILAVVQMMPLNESIGKFLAPKQTELYRDLTSSTPSSDGEASEVNPKISIDVDNTKHQAGLLVLAMGCLLTGSYFFKTRGGLLALCWVMSANGAAMSLYGLYQRINPHEKILGIYEPRYTSVPFGPYVNRNNAAGFLLICFACAIGLVYLLLQKRKTEGPKPIISNEMPAWRRFQIGFNDFVAQLTFAKFVALLLAVLVSVGIVASFSRGGAIALFFGGFVTLFFFGFARKPKSTLGFFVVIVLVTIGATSYLGFGDDITRRFNAASEAKIEDHFRVQNWSDTSAAIGEYGMMGSGLGSYSAVHRLYRKDREVNLYEYAENQYYQTLIEAGWVGTVALVLAILIAIWCFTQILRLGVSHASVAAGLIGLFVVSSISVASLFDFGLYLPANMCAMAVVVGTFCGNAHWHAQRLKRKTLLRFASPNWLTAGIGMILFAASVYSALHFYRLHEMYDQATFQPLSKNYKALPLKETQEEIDRLEPKVLLTPDAKAYLQLGQLYQHRYRLEFFEDIVKGQTFLEADKDGDLARRFWRETNTDRVHGWIYLPRLEGNKALESTRRNSKLVKRNLVLAREYMLRSLKRRPVQPETHMLLARLEPISDTPDFDAEHIRRAVELSPSNSDLRFVAGKLHLQAGRVEQACQQWRECLELDPKAYGKIMLLASQTVYHEVSKEQIYSLIIPDDPALVFRFANSLNKNKYESLRLSALNKSLELLKGHSATDFEKIRLSADVNFALGNEVNGLRDLSISVQLRPNNLRLRQLLATKLYAAGKYKEAREHAAVLVKKNSKSVSYQKLWKRINNKLN